jgi:hypothetical protein
MSVDIQEKIEKLLGQGRNSHEVINDIWKDINELSKETKSIDITIPMMVTRTYRIRATNVQSAIDMLLKHFADENYSLNNGYNIIGERINTFGAVAEWEEDGTNFSGSVTLGSKNEPVPDSELDNDNNLSPLSPR